MWFEGSPDIRGSNDLIFWLFCVLILSFCITAISEIFYVAPWFVTNTLVILKSELDFVGLADYGLGLVLYTLVAFILNKYS